ncbi:MAG: coproporphyrinogen III oxidase-like Fe-S oxidoreductase, partial [Pseudoalteromonas distincta]
MVASLIKELKERKNFIGQEEVKTIYFGGGTPSVL